MDKNKIDGKIIIPAGRKPWPHEMRVASILAKAGFTVEFIQESTIRSADILLNGVEFEIKSPFTSKLDKIERNIKRGLKQSNSIIIDSSRIKNMKDSVLLSFLIRKLKEQKQIDKLILITKRGEIVDINSLI